MSEPIGTIRTNVREGQRYVDEQVYAHLAKHLKTPVSMSLAIAWGHCYHIAKSEDGRPGYYIRTDVVVPENTLIGYHHYKLNWICQT